MDTRPNKAEREFLHLGYDRFFDLFEEIMEDRFWGRSAPDRFSTISQVFAVYTELLTYEPFKYVLDAIKNQRPPMEAEIGGPLLRFVRNVLTHFPFYDSWDNVWISKSLVNWQKDGLAIDKFLKTYSGREPVKYRFWEEKKKKMTYVTIRFPEHYDEEKIYLKDIIPEKEGVKFSLIMMRKILDTQIDTLVDTE